MRQRLSAGTLQPLMSAPARDWLLALAMLGSLPAPADARRVVPAASRHPLQEMTFKDAEKVGAVGTGCTWRGGPGLVSRMSIADDRGGVRRGGRLVALKPTADAEPLFFTFDRWSGGGIVLRIRDTGRVVRRGREFAETVASLELTERGITRSFRGRLNCGS